MCRSILHFKVFTISWRIDRCQSEKSAEHRRQKIHVGSSDEKSTSLTA
ncbi:hypothetical protein RE6C_03293 [Rhodopirellula europaea 6C]|uniref:Uncharacterized protein n=1 Tax=Rhodopirellula europaea 6C TaxID=1263867 RepID=M2A630_9BACT|nr:hypothetical protein RE6C_03293 [Rhodopirellula europaea 6C]